MSSARPAQRLADLHAGPGRSGRNIVPSTPRCQSTSRSKPIGLELGDRRPRRHIRFPRPVVEPAQVAPDRAARPSPPGNAGCTGRNWCGSSRRRGAVRLSAYRRTLKAERRLGGDVDDVRPERLDRPMDAPERGQRQVQLLVERAGRPSGPRGCGRCLRPPRRSRGGSTGRCRRGRVRCRTSSPQRPRDAVDLGEVGFRDDRDAHGTLGLGASGGDDPSILMIMAARTQTAASAPSPRAAPSERPPDFGAAVARR